MYRKCLIRPAASPSVESAPIEAWILTSELGQPANTSEHSIAFVPIGATNAKLIANTWSQFLGNEPESVSINSRDALEIRIRHRKDPIKIERIMIVVEGEPYRVWPVLGDFLEI